ncbi:3-hydroxyacyl-ACP dehydratase FabZ family protein [Poriferisphaera sp. WC338]|uniref:3-hydroxyacyl-ACP dehydratase FabZ family protein n=1 Tax=Poriferisphaera sp. WC338 TaxID=3425129 RepID=UPI003D816793
MRWIWIDRIVEIEKGERCVTIKNVSAAEEVLHDHFEATADHSAMPILPNTLIIEGMAQTAGIMVGHAADFKEKVLLAKITKATFTKPVTPGYTIRYTAHMENFGKSGASTKGTVELLDPATGDAKTIGEISLMFSHIDHNMAGLEFPDHNFVFTGMFIDLLKRSGVEIADDAVV